MGIAQHTESGDTQTVLRPWNNLEKVSFRFAFIFFFPLVVPLEWSWYERLFESASLYDVMAAIAGGGRLNLIQIVSESGRWGLASYASWGIAALIGALGAAIWTILSRDSKRQDYNVLYYGLRVAVRYRIALGLIAFGFIKFYPMQMPFPSISNLNTDIGDYAAFKLYWQIVGVSFRYEIFLGFLEIAAGVLLFFRATTAVGAIITAGVLFNIAHANFGYDGGVHVYSSYFVLLSLFLLIQYIPNIWKLFVKGERVQPTYYYPGFGRKWIKPVQYGLKTVVIFSFVVLYGYYRYDRFYNEGRLKEPVIPGLTGAAGHYAVSTFVLNGDTLRYSPYDSVRWHDAVFERYSTLVYRVNREIDISLGNGVPRLGDVLKEYELTGRAGGKTYLYYEVDSAENKLYLVDKNQHFSKAINNRLDQRNDAALKTLYGTPLGNEIHVLRWDYSRPTESSVVLSGLDANRNSISMVLDRINEIHLTGAEWYMENNRYTYR